MTLRYLPALLFFLSVSLTAQSWEIVNLPNLPEAVTNNAVCEGFQKDTTFLFTFGGLDNTKLYSGIHLRSYRYNTISKEWQSIPSLPDTKGKIAAGASRIGDTIYIVGGYHVAANGTETSSNKIHRFQISTNTYLSDGEPIPKAIDDHVQAVWRDSLIYVITGWSNTSNVNNVQVYNPKTNTWKAASPLPNTKKYKSFGASGTLIGDTIFYFGGAKYGSNFPIQNELRIGIINPNDPYQIDWTFQIPNANTVGYRMAATSVKGQPIWIGGSQITYNYNGIAYNGSGGVQPANQSHYIKNTSNPKWTSLYNDLPMDLRGLANENDTTKYLVGGMNSNQVVSDQLLQLVWDEQVTQNTNPTKSINFKLSPNPTQGKIIIDFDQQDPKRYLRLLSPRGILLLEESCFAKHQSLDINAFPKGSYLINIIGKKRYFSKWIIKE